MRPQFDSVDAYIADFPESTQKALEQVRAIASAEIPGGVETISYAIPTVDLDGRHVIHFAGYANHIGVYPAIVDDPQLAAELEPYRHGKGTVRFTLGEPLPEPLIARLVRHQLARHHARVGGTGR